MNISKEIFSERLNFFINSSKLKQKDIAVKLRVTTKHLSQLVRGRANPSGKLLEDLEKFFNLNLKWLETGEGEMFRADPREGTPIFNHDFIYVPQVAGSISAGGGLVADNAVEMKIAFRKEWIQRRGDPRNMSLIKVEGDSMEPTLLSGDLVLVDHSKQHIDTKGGIYAIAFDHEISIKRVQVLTHKKMLKVISDNKSYEAIELEPEKIIVNGKVIWYGRELER